MADFLGLAQRWIREGDALRDAGQPGKAAEAYKRAVALQPNLKSVRVQLGNMLKDSGRYGEAVEAYRVALSQGADVADTNLQLGRALRSDGRREDALEAFTEALKSDPRSRDAVQELIALGESWTVQKHLGLGAPALVEIVSALEGIKQTLSRIERSLPEVASLAAIPPTRWDLWRRIWRVPQAPATVTPIALIVMSDPALLPAVLDCLSSIERQRHPHVLTSFISTDAPTVAAIEKRASLAPYRFVPCPDLTKYRPPGALRAALDLPRIAEAEWLGVAIEPVVLDPEAAGWFAAAMSSTRVVAAFADEDTIVSSPGRPSTESPAYTDPHLKGAADPELLDQGRDLGTLIVAKRAELIAALSESTIAEAQGGTSWWAELHRRLLSEGAIEHIQHVLSSRISSVVNARSASSPPPQSGPTLRFLHTTKADACPENALNIVIPTRDRVELLQTCIDSLRATADIPNAFTVTVVDNGSREPATLEYFQRVRREGWVRILARNEPFNWARLNNGAVNESTAPLLVFCNNDIEMISAGWDTILRRHLARPEIGAVGSRLLYPDRTVQHAGIVLGIGVGGTEHEGRGALASDRGPDNRWHTRRTVAAVTGAFLACRRSEFESAGGFDADLFGIWFNDVDFCLKLSSRGLRVLYEPAIEAYHHESKSLAVEFDDQARAAHFIAAASAMRMKWGKVLEDDPYFNVHYARWGTPFALLGAPNWGKQ